VWPKTVGDGGGHIALLSLEPLDMHVIVRRAGISFGALVLLIVLLAATVYVASERRVNAKVIPGSLARARADA